MRTSANRRILLLLLVLLLFIGAGSRLCAARNSRPGSPVKPPTISEPPSRQNSTKIDLQKACKKILGPNPGAILVFDLDTRTLPVAVNPEIAFKTAYRPGSLFKLVTAATLLEGGKVDPYRAEECRNYFASGGRKYTCSQPGGHGSETLIDALGNSCSVYFYRAGNRLTPGTLRKQAEKLGCGKIFAPPGLNGKPAAGNCSPPEDPRKLIEFAVGDDGGITMTPWQVANLVTIVATGKPAVPGLAAPRLKPRTLEILRDGMKQSARSGTCKALGKAGIDAAAKTGTSTNFRNPGKYHGWFAGYMPASGKPRYVVVVFLEDGRGYTDAVPLGVKVMQLFMK